MSLKKCYGNVAYEPSRSVVENWEEVAFIVQQTFCETLGDSDWESYSITEHNYMHKKVGYALFGPPVEGGIVEYDSFKMEKIKHICKIVIEQDDHSLLEENSETWMSIIFVCLAIKKTKNHTEVVTEPVFRVPRYCDGNDSTLSFIDRNGRVYKSWKDYLQNNKLPRCSYCYPKNGIYYLNTNCQVDLEFGKTPESKLSSRICSGLDQATACVSAGSMGLAVAALAFPVSAPIVTTSILSSVVCSLYGIGRNTNEIIDRKQHEEDIGLTNSVSRNCWLSLVGNTVGILSCGASRIVSKIAQNGNTLNMPGKVCVAALNVTSCTVSGINVANELLNLDEERRKKDISPLDVAQLISSVIFFGHSVLSSKAALNLIKEAHQGRLQKVESSVRSNKYRKVLSDLTTNIVGMKSELLQNGKIIRSVKYIEEIGESFLKNVVLFNPEYSRISHIIDESGIRHTISYFRELILSATRNFVTRVSNSLPQAGLQPMNLLFNDDYHGRTQNMVKYSENSTETSGNSLAPKVTGFNVRGHIITLLHELGEFNIPLLLQLGGKIFDALDNPLGRSICDVLNIIYMFINDVVSNMENLYLEELQDERRLLGPNFSLSDFDQKYKISGKRFEYFCSVALRSVSLVGEIFKMLKDACCVNYYKASDTESVRSTSPRCRELVIPWTFTNSCESVPIMKVQALQIARDLTNEDINCNNSVVAYSESEIFVVIEDESIFLNVVKIKCHVEDQIIVASVMC